MVGVLLTAIECIIDKFKMADVIIYVFERFWAFIDYSTDINGAINLSDSYNYIYCVIHSRPNYLSNYCVSK